MLVREKVLEEVLHVPVLAQEVVRALDVQPGGRYLDCTVGTGGHARAILEAASPGGLLLGIDLDGEALALAAERLAPFGPDVRLVEGDYRDLATICRQFNFVPVHGVLFDLGLSSYQLARPERGFSFQLEGPLDMRFDQGQETTAFDIVNGLPERELADLIWRYGEEPAARRIARAIVQARPIRTTTELAQVVARAAGRGPGRLHPATRTFQALRMAVNQELEGLEMALVQAVQVLGRGGRLVVISYHSLEDRLVKRFIAQESRDCICPPQALKCRCGHRATLRPVVRGVIRPSPQEVAANVRARSARLRVAEKV
jgi:16S rRNA (cytosine1402-N4)-methyltransferase